VSDVRVTQAPPRWWRLPYLYVSWRDSEGKISTFSIRSANVRSMRQLGRATRKLAEQLDGWRDDTSEAAPPTALADLGAPSFGAVTSMPLGTSVRLRVLLRESCVIALCGVGVSFLFSLPLIDGRGGLGWFVPAAGVLAYWIEVGPHVLGRRRSSTPTPPPMPPPARVVAVTPEPERLQDQPA
jgi:hypothetical protein